MPVGGVLVGLPGAALRAELVKRLAFAETKAHAFPARRNTVRPV